MLQTSPDATAGAKERLLTSFLGKLKAQGVKPEYTLTDKDQSEINAMTAVWPEAKHQLCFWHVLRALKQRLAKTNERPGAYSVQAAHDEGFHFISETFLPLSQQTVLVSKHKFYSRVQT